ncbi:hypothetical protein DRN38_06275, partial [Thermococci archaeon]
LKADLLPAVNGEGSNELTPRYGRFGLRAHHLLPSPVSIQPAGRVFGPLPLPPARAERLGVIGSKVTPIVSTAQGRF